MTAAPPVTGPGGKMGPKAPIKGTGTGGGFNWDPVSWVASAADWTSGEIEQGVSWSESEAIGAIKWTASKIEKVGSLVVSFVEAYIHSVESLLFRIIGSIHFLLSELNQGLVDVRHWAAGAVNFAEHAATMVATLVGHGVSLFNTAVLQPAIHAISHEFDALEGAVKAQFHDVTHILDQLRHGAAVVVDAVSSSVSRFVVQHVDSAIHTVEQDVIKPIEAEVKSQGEALAGLAGAIGADTLKALEVLTEAAWAILLLAEYTPEVISSAFDSQKTAITAKGVLPSAAQRTQTTKELDAILKGLL